ncbi:MAG TPA: hypothetical protein VFC23_06735 [Thermoanaerobaculia bacterium]|nr:hypothetical protein [Thermoanaerobaculia bacterium]
MTELQQLVQRLRADAPDVELSLDCPAPSGLSCWLDVKGQGKFVVVEWRAGCGFGVSLLPETSNPLEGLFQGPDEIFTSVDAARERILSLLGFEDEQVVLKKVAHR